MEDVILFGLIGMVAMVGYGIAVISINIYKETKK